MKPLDYYMQGHTKILVYEVKAQALAELASCFLNARAQIRNDGIMLCRVINSLLKRVRTCSRDGDGHFEQLIVISYFMIKNCKTLHSILLFCIFLSASCVHSSSVLSIGKMMNS
jgi:hypothetical protein